MSSVKKLSTTIEVEDLIMWHQTAPEKLLSMDPVLVCLVEGTYDKDSVLSKLNGTPHIMQHIWDIITDYYKKFIQEVCPEQSDDVFLQSVSAYDVTFPPPTDICINMMPFVMEPSFERSRLPDYLEPYWNAIIQHDYKNRVGLIPHEEYGKIGFLTIHESYVETGQSQRRGGVHTESPGKMVLRLNEDGRYTCEALDDRCQDTHGVHSTSVGEGKSVVHVLRWGAGTYERRGYKGGIYMCSNVDNSCRIWNCQIQPDEHGNEVIGLQGDVEHLRSFLPNGMYMRKNEMFWLTDRTPHESLPLPEGTYRQYFRLVTSEVSVWYEDHCTKNPLGVVPDPEKTRIVSGSKFA